MKIALIALVIGAGACVADDPESTSTRVDTSGEIGAINVVNEIEIPPYGEDFGNFAVVTLTGVEIPGRAPTTEHIDIANVDITELDPETRKLCAQADQLPGSDTCSALCDPAGFAARVFDQGTAPGSCQTTRCALPGDIVVDATVCTSTN